MPSTHSVENSSHGFEPPSRLKMDRSQWTTDFQLIYDDGTTTLSQRHTTLANLRTRTTALFTATGLAVPLSTGYWPHQHEYCGGSLFLNWAALSLLGLLAVIGPLSIYVLWPVSGFAFGPDFSVMYSLYDAAESDDDILKFTILVDE
jgi:hypothetical protein